MVHNTIKLMAKNYSHNQKLKRKKTKKKNQNEVILTIFPLLDGKIKISLLFGFSVNLFNCNGPKPRITITKYN